MFLRRQVACELLSTGWATFVRSVAVYGVDGNETTFFHINGITSNNQGNHMRSSLKRKETKAGFEQKLKKRFLHFKVRGELSKIYFALCLVRFLVDCEK